MEQKVYETKLQERFTNSYAKLLQYVHKFILCTCHDLIHEMDVARTKEPFPISGT